MAVTVNKADVALTGSYGRFLRASKSITASSRPWFNSFLNPGSYNVIGNAVREASTITDPNGGLKAFKIRPSITGPTLVYIGSTSNVFPTDGGTRPFQTGVYVRSDASSTTQYGVRLQLSARNPSSSVTSSAWIDFYPHNGTVSVENAQTGWGGFKFSKLSIGNGWWKLVLNSNYAQSGTINQVEAFISLVLAGTNSISPTNTTSFVHLYAPTFFVGGSVDETIGDSWNKTDTTVAHRWNGMSWEPIVPNIYTATLSKDAVGIRTDSSGTFGDYTGVGSTTVSVFEGNFQLSYDNSGNPGTFTVAITSNGITAGSLSTGGLNAILSQPSNISADAATITYTINIVGVSGATAALAKVQNFNRIRAGAQGELLNTDRYCTMPSEWGDFNVFSTKPTFTTGSTVSDIPGVSAISNPVSGTTFTLASTNIIINGARKYRLSITAKTLSGSPTVYLGVAWLDSNMNHLSSVTPAGWSNGTFSYFGLLNSVPPSTAQAYSIEFGPGTSAEIPTNARGLRIMAYLCYSGTGFASVGNVSLVDVTDVLAAQNAATAAQDAATAAQTTATNAFNNAATANNAIAESAADNKLSPVEKQRDIIIYNQLVGEKTGIDTQADAYSITTLKTAYGTAHSSLVSNVGPLLSSLTTTTDITGSTYRGWFDSVLQARQALLNKIADEAGKRANWTSVNGRPTDEAIHNNLTDLSWWKQDGTRPWPDNAEYNRLVNTGTVGGTDLAFAGPKGGTDTVWYCKEQTGNGEQGGGWNSGTFISPLNPAKTYRFVVPIRRVSGSGTAFWGCGGACNLNTTSTAPPADNPYFANINTTTLLSDRWYLFVGYVYPYASVNNTNETAGIWDCKTGLKVSGGINWNHSIGGVTGHRAYQFYASLNAEQVFGRPLINLVDGTEPSLREYFEPNAVLNDVLIPSITAASNAAATAQGTANTASTNASSALSTLATMRSNGYLDAAEKPAVIREWTAIANEQAGIVAQGAAYSQSTTTYTAAYNALGSYLSSLSPGWSDTTTDTPITPAVDQAKWADYYAAREALLRAVATEAGKRAQWTLTTGRPNNIANLSGSESILNNEDSIIRSPAGGLLVTTGAYSGAIKIRLPQSYTDTMMRFFVDIYEYATNFSCTLEIAGYTYTAGATWLNCTARVQGGSNVEYPVRFGHDGTKVCVWIGDPATETWSYPQVRVRDWLGGYTNYSATQWATGWAITIESAAIPGTPILIADTLPGADWSKTARRPANVAALTGTELIRNDQITINANGQINNAGGGQVTIDGLGYVGDLGATNDALMTLPSNFTQRGATINRVSGVEDWGFNAVGRTPYKGGSYIEATVRTSDHWIIALDDSPTTSTYFTAFNYALHNSFGNLYVYEGGTLIVGPVSAPDGRRVGIYYDGSSVVYLSNGVSIRTSSATANQTFTPVASMAYNGQKVEGMRFGAYGNPSAVTPANPINSSNSSAYIAADALQLSQINNVEATNGSLVTVGPQAINVGDGDVTSDGVTATASVSFFNDGTSDGGLNYYLPTTSGIGSSLWLRITRLSGSTPSGITLGSWIQLNTTRTITLTATNQVKRFEGKAELSTSSSGSPIVALGNVTLYAESYSGAIP